MSEHRTAAPDLGPATRRGPGRDPTVDVGGFYGSLAEQIPLFAAVGALSLLVGLIPFPHPHTGEVLSAGAIFVVLTTAAFVLPWRRLPLWTWLVVPVGYLVVIALLGDARGGAGSGLSTIYFLPIVWIAFYGQRSHVIVGLVAVAAALIVPMVAIGPPDYPLSEWRMVVVIVVGGALVSFTFLTMVNRDRSYAAEMAEQAVLVAEGARQAETAREQLASLLRAATETAIVGFDLRGKVTFFSAGAEKMFGRAADQVVDKRRVVDFIDPSELVLRRSEIAGLATGSGGGSHPQGGGESSVWTYVRSDGTRRRMSVVVTAQPKGAGAGGFVLVASDVTEREQLVTERERLLAVQHEVTQVLVEQNKKLQELTRMKDDVVTTVSHELRTPLTVIRGFVELLLEPGTASLSEEQVHMLATIDRSSLQLLRVADDLLADPALGRGLHVQFVETDVSLLAREAVEAMAGAAADRGLQLTVVAEQPVMVSGDPSRLHQLLANLISNAVKFTPPGGRVQVHAVSLGRFARIDVLDDGPGIPPAERQQLFERFYRLASTAEEGIPGTGLGLAIAKTVVEAHNGTVDIVDTPGWVTTFRVHLPATGQGDAAPHSPHASQKSDARSAAP